MLYSDKLVHTQQQGAWTLHFYEVSNTVGGYLCTSVELLLADTRKGRLTLTRPGLPSAEVVNQLRARALAWIEDFNQRDHTGSTGFSDL
jgi:hypothetical protein